MVSALTFLLQTTRVVFEQTCYHKFPEERSRNDPDLTRVIALRP